MIKHKGGKQEKEYKIGDKVQIFKQHFFNPIMNKKIGTIKQLQGAYVLVDVDGEGIYWICTDYLEPFNPIPEDFYGKGSFDKEVKNAKKRNKAMNDYLNIMKSNPAPDKEAEKDLDFQIVRLLHERLYVKSGKDIHPVKAEKLAIKEFKAFIRQLLKKQKQEIITEIEKELHFKKLARSITAADLNWIIRETLKKIGTI